MAESNYWNSRPWGKPQIEFVMKPGRIHEVAWVSFKYHGLRVQGVRVVMNHVGKLEVSWPRKNRHDFQEYMPVYFHDPVEREQFIFDVLSLLKNEHMEKISAVLAGEEVGA